MKTVIAATSSETTFRMLLIRLKVAI